MSICWGGGLISVFLRGGGVVRYRGVIKQKSPDFRSPDVGISVVMKVELQKLKKFC